MTVIYPSPIFGPVHSRRLGISLGVNLLPGTGKMCSFDCLYCECGLNAEHRPTTKIPTREEVRSALEHQLQQMVKDGVLPDVLTFAGNGEPTLHPGFPDIVQDTIALRDRYVPTARISVLSNATTVTNPRVHEALMKVDNNIQKVDTVDIDYIHRLDRPTGHYDLTAIVKALCAFGGHVIIQTMFLEGTDTAGVDIGNTSEKFVEPWLRVIESIKPRSVMIYTIDRETPVKSLRKAAPVTLDAIADRVRNSGIECSVAY